MRSLLPAVVAIFSALIATYSVANEKSFVVTTEEWPPFVASQLPQQGWAMEVARAALEPQGYQVTLKLLPWARAVRCAKKGECDGLYLAYYAEDRTESFVFSEPIGEVKTGFFKLRERGISFQSLEDLKGLKIGLTRDAAVSDEFDNADFLQKEEVPDDGLNLRKLLKGRVDLIAAADPVLPYLARMMLPEEEVARIEFMSPALSVQPLHMAVSRNSPDYLTKVRDFNNGLSRIKADGTYARILEAHGF